MNRPFRLFILALVVALSPLPGRAETRLALLPVAGKVPGSVRVGGAFEIETDILWNRHFFFGMQGLAPNGVRDDTMDAASDVTAYSASYIGYRWRKASWNGLYAGVGVMGHLGLIDQPYVALNPEAGLSVPLNDRIGLEALFRYSITSRLPDGSRDFYIAGLGLSIRLN